MKIKQLFHKHKWKKVEIWTTNWLSGGEDVGDHRTEAIGYTCFCGKRKADTFSYFRETCDFHTIHVQNQRNIIEWLNDAPRKSADIVKLRIVK